MAVLKILAFMYIAYMFLRVMRAVPLMARRTPRRAPNHFSPYDVYQKAFFAAFQQAAQQRRTAAGDGPPPSSDAGPEFEARPSTSDGPKDPFAVLQVTRGSSLEQIRRAYQARVRLYHPDRLVDLAPELKDLAERRTKEINEAYATLKRLAASPS